MTDIVDDDLINSSKPTTSGSNSSMTSSSRRTMLIETELRTESITKRRVGSTTGSRSVYDILENTKSPTDGLPPTTYTYAHSVSYMPVTQNGTYDVPVMARRDLHGDYRLNGSSSFTSTNSLFSSPARIFSNVRSQLVNSYSAIRNRLTHHNDQNEGPVPIMNSPTTTRSTRFARTSSQSSATNGQTTGYNLRRRAPVHSTPRDNDSEQIEQRRTTTTQRESQDERPNAPVESAEELKEEKTEKTEEGACCCIGKNLLLAPLKVLSSVWNSFINLPWWLLIPLILLIGFFALPNLACKSFERYPESKIYQRCRDFQQYRDNVVRNSYNTMSKYSYKSGLKYLQQCYQSIINLKNKMFQFLNDLCSNTKNTIQRQFNYVVGGVTNFFTKKAGTAKGYCDASLQKVNDLIEEFKREKEKYFGSRPVLKPSQEQELEALVRKLLEEYAADETGQADYALEANGGKIVDTRCTEYTDEPRQNVVKFLGIPIVHMSKQPDIMIKAGRMPGQCFPFKGDQGSVIIKLAIPVKPTEFVLEHLSKSISVVGHINSAPNNFTVYALKDKNDKEGTVLGRYYYDSENGPSLQRFKPQLVNVPVVEYIELRVLSNWGNPNYTCVYRFRVHGDLPAPPPAA